MCENLSIYIPIISNTTSKNFIIKQFLEHNIGKIKKIDFVLNLKKIDQKHLFISMNGLTMINLFLSIMILKIIILKPDLYIMKKQNNIGLYLLIKILTK